MDQALKVKPRRELPTGAAIASHGKWHPELRACLWRRDSLLSPPAASRAGGRGRQVALWQAGHLAMASCDATHTPDCSRNHFYAPVKADSMGVSRLYSLCQDFKT